MVFETPFTLLYWFLKHGKKHNLAFGGKYSKMEHRTFFSVSTCCQSSNFDLTIHLNTCKLGHGRRCARLDTCLTLSGNILTTNFKRDIRAKIDV